jgi:hypothetical protein
LIVLQGFLPTSAAQGLLGLLGSTLFPSISARPLPEYHRLL